MQLRSASAHRGGRKQHQSRRRCARGVIRCRWLPHPEGSWNQGHFGTGGWPWATLLATVAARIERIEHPSRNMPNASALELYSADELTALRMMRKRYYPHATLPDTDALSVGTATAWLADRGGYVQTSARRPPGTVVLARGLERLRLCVDAMIAARNDHGRTEK